MSLRARQSNLYVRSMTATDAGNMSAFTDPTAVWDFVGWSINREKDEGRTLVNAGAGYALLSQQDVPICVSRSEHDFNGDSREDIINFAEFASQFLYRREKQRKPAISKSLHLYLLSILSVKNGTA